MPSWIWAHDAPNKPLNTIHHLDANRRPIWKCGPCWALKRPVSTTYAKASGTTVVARHLKNKHRINKPLNIDEDNEDDINSVQQDLEGLSATSGTIAMAFRQINQLKTRKRARITTLEDVDASHLLELYQNYIVDCTLSFRHVERPAFRAFIAGINPYAEGLLPKSHSTISQGIVERYNVEKHKIRALLQTSLTRIHLSCDAWTGANKAYLGITARFANTKGRQHLTLAIKQLRGSHTGENMAAVLCEVAQDFGIAPMMGFCNADNASPNDTMTQHVEDELRAQGIVWEAKANRLRCVGHINNLAVQAFLHGRHPNTLDDLEVPTVEQMANWYKTGTLGTLHALLVYIYASPQRIESLLELSDNKNLVRDNDTRWTSWYDTIERVLELMEKMVIWQMAHRSNRRIKDSERPIYLDDDDWTQLRIYYDFLKPYKDVTLQTEGLNDGLDKILLSMDILFQHLENGREQYKDDRFFAAAIETSWAVMQKYYNLTDESPAYVAAVVMDPRRKWDYFERHWTATNMKLHKEKAKLKVSELLHSKHY
jgi:hypothetical protein